MQQRSATNARIRGRKWMATRERIMARDCGMCQPCKRKGQISIGTEVDHITAISNGGSNDDENLEVICRQCHNAKTDEDLGYRHKPTIGVDGWPTEQDVSARPVWRRDGYR